MYPLVEPRQRPERFLLNRFSPLAESAAFLGLGGFDAAGSVWYPDARRLLGGVPNDGTLTNMDPATDWVRLSNPAIAAVNQRSGTTAYISVPIALASGTYTICSWIGNTQTTAYLFDARQSDGAGVGYLFVSSGTLTASSGTTYVNGVASSAFAGDGVVRHVAVAGITLSVPTLLVFGNRNGSGLAPNSARQSIGPTADWMILSSTRTAELSALADPSNVMLEVGGVPLILPPHRVSFPAAVAEPSGFKPYWARPSYQIIGGGIA